MLRLRQWWYRWQLTKTACMRAELERLYRYECRVLAENEARMHRQLEALASEKSQRYVAGIVKRGRVQSAG